MVKKNSKNSSQLSMFPEPVQKPIPPLPKVVEEAKEVTVSKTQDQSPSTTHWLQEIPEEDDIPFSPGTYFRLVGIENGDLCFYYD